MNSLHDAIASGASVLQIGVLTGIFFRLGSLTAAHRSFSDRIARIESKIFGGTDK